MYQQLLRSAAASDSAQQSAHKVCNTPGSQHADLESTVCAVQYEQATVGGRTASKVVMSQQIQLIKFKECCCDTLVAMLQVSWKKCCRVLQNISDKFVTLTSACCYCTVVL